MDPEIEGQGTEETSVAEPVSSEQGTDQGGSGLNPAWNDLLGVVPSQLHSLVTPHLQKWDKNYQDGISKVHSQYEAYKPYVDQQIRPDQINYALQLMQAIEERPEEVIAALQQYSGTSQPAEAQQIQPDEQGLENIPSEFLNHPQFKQMNEMVNTMAQLMVQQNQTQQFAQEDQALEAELASLRQTHGDYDEEWVLAKALANPQVPLETHVKAYKDLVNGILAEQRKPGPKVLPSGGQAPNSQVDVKSLDEKGRRSLIQQMLASAHES